MKKIKFIKKLQMTLFLGVCLLFFNQEGISQKNTIKITPLKAFSGKVNLSYERQLTKQWAILIDAQRWFINDKEKKDVGLFEFNFGQQPAPVFESNNGTRLSLELRTYVQLKQHAKMKRDFYFGFGGFVGNHEISMERKKHTSSSTSWWDGNITTNIFPRLFGEVDLISGGMFFDFGFKVKLGKAIVLELGVIAGRAWTNQENNFVTLISEEPYFLESELEKLEESYSKGISDAFFQPMFNVGYSF